MKRSAVTGLSLDDGLAFSENYGASQSAMKSTRNLSARRMRTASTNVQASYKSSMPSTAS